MLQSLRMTCVQDARLGETVRGGENRTSGKEEGGNTSNSFVVWVL